ncbi:MAG: hypothetical protein HY786_09740 [Deltaproteobacteria bacterium]|nr:hypothetical protein [Deltaproteobacteria bacterium]
MKNKGYNNLNYYLKTANHRATEINFEYKNLLKPFSSLCSHALDLKIIELLKSHLLSAWRRDLKQGFASGIKGFSPLLCGSIAGFRI